MLNKMEYTIYDCWIDGLFFRFRDISSSNTVSLVVEELLKDDYGLNHIYLDKEDTFIDVGANIGIVSIFAKKKFGCKVIAFEPFSGNIENFKENIKLNGFELSDFEIHEKAVTGIEEGTVKLAIDYNNTGNCYVTYEGAYDNDIDIQSTRLDKFITPDVKYIKMDCELGEYLIIPTIKDKLQDVKYIGIEFHRTDYPDDPIALYHQLRETFTGKMFISAWDFETTTLADRLIALDKSYYEQSR
jgi:FkbM family methyltransferase